VPRTYKLTWQPGSDRNPAGRWKKKYKGKTYYFPGGRGKTDRQAYEAALAEWERVKLKIDASLPKPHQVEYERAIREWETVLTWCRKHPGDDEMVHTALSKLHSLRRQFAAANQNPSCTQIPLMGILIDCPVPQDSQRLLPPWTAPGRCPKRCSNCCRTTKSTTPIPSNS
jgi:hypothetical protein